MEMDNLFSRFFAHYGLHLHTKRDFIKKRNGMRLFPGATVDDPAALKQTEPCGFEFEVVFCVCKMTYLFHTHILFHGRGDNREKNIMMLYLFHCLSFFFFFFCASSHTKCILSILPFPHLSRYLFITNSTTEYYPSTIRPPALAPAPARPPPTHKHKPKPKLIP